MESSLSKLTSWPRSGVIRVTLVGAGNLCHVFAGLLGARSDVKVSILSRKANDIQSLVSHGVTVKIIKGNQEEFITGKVEKVSSDPQQVIPDADVVLITVPSQARAQIMSSISPHLSRDRRVLVGVMPGMGGFDYIAKSALAKVKNDSVILFGLKDVPYMCAWTVPGKSVTFLGPKTGLYLALATYSDSHAQVAAHVMFNLTGIPTHILPTFLVITLTPGNPIIHPSLMYGLFGPHSQWDGKPLREKPLLYEDCTEMGAYFLSLCDNEVQTIKKEIMRRTGLDLTVVWPLRENLKHVYGDQVADNRTLLLALKTNAAYRTIRTPLKPIQIPLIASSSSSNSDPRQSQQQQQYVEGFTIDTQHRFFAEDVPFGLVVLRDIADMIGVATPMIDEVLIWHQELMKKEYLIEDTQAKKRYVNEKVYCLRGKDIKETGAPSVYDVRTLEDLVRGSKPSNNAHIKAKI